MRGTSKITITIEDHEWKGETRAWLIYTLNITSDVSRNACKWLQIRNRIAFSIWLNTMTYLVITALAAVKEPSSPL